MDSAENLQSLHQHEEALRAEGLSIIKARPNLSDHWVLVSEAMNLIYAFSHDHSHESEDELTLQLLGVRLFNAAGASVKLALAGYYQKAFDQVRDVLETSFLVDFLRTYPDRIKDWKDSDKKMRIAQFGPGIVRNALDKRDGFTSGARKKIYDLLSEYASHAAYPGFVLMMNDKKLGQVGPFLDETKLAPWLEEIVKRLSHAAVVLVAGSDSKDRALLMARAHYLQVMNEWRVKYFR